MKNLILYIAKNLAKKPESIEVEKKTEKHYVLKMDKADAEIFSADVLKNISCAVSPNTSGVKIEVAHE